MAGVGEDFFLGGMIRPGVRQGWSARVWRWKVGGDGWCGLGYGSECVIGLDGKDGGWEVDPLKDGKLGGGWKVEIKGEKGWLEKGVKGRVVEPGIG